MSAGKISCRWHRPDRFLGASQAGLTSRLTAQESLDPEELSQVHDVVGGRSALLIARMTLTASRRARRPGSRSWQLQYWQRAHHCRNRRRDPGEPGRHLRDYAAPPSRGKQRAMVSDVRAAAVRTWFQVVQLVRSEGGRSAQTPQHPRRQRVEIRPVPNLCPMPVHQTRGINR